MTINGLNIQIKDVSGTEMVAVVSLDEAKAIWFELSKLFGNPSTSNPIPETIPWFVPNTPYISTPTIPWQYPFYNTCEATSENAGYANGYTKITYGSAGERFVEISKPYIDGDEIREEHLHRRKTDTGNKD